MKLGQISESIYKRSIKKELQFHREEVLSGAELRTNCAIFCSKDSIISTKGFINSYKNGGALLGIEMVENYLIAKGAELIGVNISGVFSEKLSEKKMRDEISLAHSYAKERNIQILSFDAEVLPGVNESYYVVSGLGVAGDADAAKKVENGDDIVITKYVGISGTSYIADNYREELKKRLPSDYIDAAKNMRELVPIGTEAALARKSGAKLLWPLSKGGIYGNLWEMAESTGVGLCIDLKKIPIKQETVEICNYFDINPYKLMSDGSLMIITSNGYDLVSILSENGINAAVVGKVTAGNDRLILNEDEKKYLTMPETDELLKL